MQWWPRLVEGMARHPRYPMAMKAAAAAALAWGAVQPLGGFADDYPYYAPFGAVIAVSTSVASSLKVSVQSVSAILTGAVLAFAAAQLPWSEVALMAVVVAAGVLAGGWRGFGTSGEWVPIAALFVLVIGNADRVEYAAAYLGLTSLGALIGVLLNGAVPPLPLTPVADTLTSLRETLAEQLDDLADGLRQDDPPSLEEWEQRQKAIDPHARRLRRVVASASEARRVNWRAKRWREATDEQIEQAHALQRLVLIIEDLTVLVVDHERQELEQVALGPDLRRHAADAMGRAADVLRHADEDSTGSTYHDAAREAIDEMSAAVVEQQQKLGGDMFAAGAMVIALRQTLTTAPQRPAPPLRPRV